MKKTLFVTYDGDCCYFEPVKDQVAHQKRILEWLDAGTDISILLFLINKEDVLAAIGTCRHTDLYVSVMERDMRFECRGEAFHVEGVFGGFCAKRKEGRVVYTRDSEDFKPTQSIGWNFHSYSVLSDLNKMLMTYLQKNQEIRGAQCKKPVLSFFEQVKKLRYWKDAYEKWERKDKGGFPEISKDIVFQAQNISVPRGIRPAVEINFYLSTITEHLCFVTEVLWPLEFGKCDKYGCTIMENQILKEGVKWPSGIIRPVCIDIEAYKGPVFTSWEVWDIEKDPIHVEIINHFLMHGFEYPKHQGITIPIPGIRVYDGIYSRLGYRIVADGDGIALAGSEQRSDSIIASRLS